MTEMHPIHAMRQVNEQMGGDAVYVDNNKIATYLPDFFYENLPDFFYGTDGDPDTENEPTRVIVEWVDDVTAHLVTIDGQGCRTGSYGTIYEFAEAQRLGY